MEADQIPNAIDHQKKRRFHRPMEFRLESQQQRTLIEQAFFMIPELQDQELAHIRISSADVLTANAVIGTIVTHGLYKAEYDEFYPELQSMTLPMTVITADGYDYTRPLPKDADHEEPAPTFTYGVAIGADNPNCRYVIFMSDRRCTLLVIDEYMDIPRAATHADALLEYRMDIFYQSIMDKATELNKAHGRK